MNFEEELKKFKPSNDTENIEPLIAGMDLTDMNDLLVESMEKAVSGEKRY